MQNVVRWLTARAKWLENTLVLFRRCEDRAPFTGLILRCLLVWPWQNSPRVHSSVTSLQKRKWEECVKTNFQGRVRVGGREKEALIVIFHCAILSLEDQKRHSCTSIIQTENAEMKSNNQVFFFFFYSKKASCFNPQNTIIVTSPFRCLYLVFLSLQWFSMSTVDSPGPRLSPVGFYWPRPPRLPPDCLPESINPCA